MIQAYHTIQGPAGSSPCVSLFLRKEKSPMFSLDGRTFPRSLEESPTGVRSQLGASKATKELLQTEDPVLKNPMILIRF